MKMTTVVLQDLAPRPVNLRLVQEPAMLQQLPQHPHLALSQPRLLVGGCLQRTSTESVAGSNSDVYWTASIQLAFILQACLT